MTFPQLRRAAIELDYQNLNPEQRQGVLTTQGPLLLLAGAGSGKTTVLIHRVANLMTYGRASDSEDIPDWVTPDDLEFLQAYVASNGRGDKARMVRLCALEPALPWSILAITFTNKAAGELKSRLEAKLGPAAQDIWAATFHSACLRILRRDIDKLGFPKSFTIYDTDDSLRVIKDSLKALGLDDKTFPPRSVLGYISRAKDEGLLAKEYLERQKKTGDRRLMLMGELYSQYQSRLWDAGALDFDDLILHTVRLLENHEDVRSFYQNKFRYVLIDEYQDTNNLQYRLASLLAGKWENICVVGDDDQSIYRFRGATIENILSFESQYQGARVIRLEQNYRSTGNILAASNAVIANNQGRKGKKLWTQHGQGEKLQLYTAMNESDEGQYVANQILDGLQKGRKFQDYAILYRMNAQSREIENAMKRNGIPYRIIGGTRFFDRAEVKDMVAYLCVLQNPQDDLRLTRIINNPPRGIGAATIERAQAIATQSGLSLWDVVVHAADYPELQRAAQKLREFTRLMVELHGLLDTLPLPDFYEELLARTGYAAMLEAKNTVEDRTRLENARELLTSINSYLDSVGGQGDLAGFLDEIALYTTLDDQSDTENCVVMMTMHSAKGLEFPVVFLVGVEEGIFPGQRSVGEPEEMEEERRLCYVAMTRAKEVLHITSAGQRMLFGHTSCNRPSRFTGEIPEECVERSGRDFRSAYDPTMGAWELEVSPGRVRQEERESFWDDDPPARERRRPYSRPYDSPFEKRPYSPYGGQSAPRSKAATEAARQAVVRRAKASMPKAPPLPDFQVGDAVVHTAFGQGTILSLQKMASDALVEISFQGAAGTKRLMLRSAAAHMKKL